MTGNLDRVVNAWNQNTSYVDFSWWKFEFTLVESLDVRIRLMPSNETTHC